jgi:hypothetical protein
MTGRKTKQQAECQPWNTNLTLAYFLKCDDIKEMRSLDSNICPHGHNPGQQQLPAVDYQPDE